MVTTNEHLIAKAVIEIASNQKNGIATFRRLYSDIPKHIALSAGDLAPSKTRNGEPMWHQIVRNIKSHYNIEGNAIYEGWLEHIPRVGYKVTARGRARV